MRQFTVDPRELERAAEQMQRQAEQATHIKQELETIQLSRGDFGYIPGLGNKCWDAYSDHVEACGESLAQLSRSLTTLSRATADTASDYRATEQTQLGYLRQLTAVLGEDKER